MRLPILRFRSRVLAVLVGLTIVGSGLVSTQMAAADTAPVDPALPVTVSTDALPTAQANGIVWSQVIVGNTVYAGGSFTTAQPAGAAAGVSTVARSNILAYSLSTGQLTPFAPVLNGQVRGLAASPDGTRLYVVGDFTQVNGTNRFRIAAFDIATGNLITTFAPGVNARVSAVVATNSTVYFGGSFNSIANVSRPSGLAAVSASSGAVLPWAPVAAGGRALTMVINPTGSKLVLGGSFTTLNGAGNPGYGMGAVDAVTGTSNQTWKVGTLVRNGGANAAIYSLFSDGIHVYGTGYHFGSGGNLEGMFKATWTDGTLVAMEDCSGDTYSAFATASVVYIAGHPHLCGNVPNGFGESPPYHALAFTNFPRGTLPGGTFSGRPAMELLNWYPLINTGAVSGSNQGAWHVTGNSQYIVFGGEFTMVNGKRQQGLVRFAIPSIAPNDDGPRLSGTGWKPSATQTAEGTVRINWGSNWDRDNRTLTYRILRDDALVGTVTGDSAPYKLPGLSFTDPGLASGTTYVYGIRAEDAWGNVALSATVTIKTSGTAPPPVVAPASFPVYRFWSPVYNSHFYTISVAERDQVVQQFPGTWTYEGQKFRAFTTQVPGTVPLYRFWSDSLGGHFYTASESEKQHVIDAFPDSVWRYERIAYYVYPVATQVTDSASVARFWSDAYGHHFYTASATEAELVKTNYPDYIWRYEREAFRVMPAATVAGDPGPPPSP